MVQGVWRMYSAYRSMSVTSTRAIKNAGTGFPLVCVLVVTLGVADQRCGGALDQFEGGSSEVERATTPPGCGVPGEVVTWRVWWQSPLGDLVL